MTDYKNVVRINGKTYDTIIDEDGVVRFPANSAIAWLAHGKLNEMAEFFNYGFISGEDMRQVYRLIGYSISGYADIFPKDSIEYNVIAVEDECVK